MRQIGLCGPRARGRVTVVDADAVVPPGRWFLSANGYAIRNAPPGEEIYLHRLIAGTPPGFDTDHVNGDRLDNRRANLRVASRSENNANAGRRSHSSQPFKGVRRKGSRWQARIRVRGREIALGSFTTAEEASAAYDAAARLHFGAFAHTNGDHRR